MSDKTTAAAWILLLMVSAGIINACEAKKPEDCHIKSRWGYLLPVHYVSCRAIFWMNQDG